MQYFKSTEPEKVGSTLLQLPIKLCVAPRLRLKFLGDIDNADNDVWRTREEDWKAFWKSQGDKESVAKAGKVSTNGELLVGNVSSPNSTS
jgi:trafficking protein particle complex subunit 8